MFLSAIVLALVIGTVAGGGFPRLADLRLRWSLLLLGAIGLRLAAELSSRTDLGAAIPSGLLYLSAYALILVWLWGNWRVPGLQVAAIGIGANMLAVVASGGRMPVWSAAFYAAGFETSDITGDPFHFLLQTDTVAGFVAAGGLFGDVVPLPIPFIRDVVSIGDLLLALGIMWTIVYSMTRSGAPTRAAVALAPNPLLRAVPAAAGSAGLPYADGSVIPAEMSATEATEAGVRRQSPYLRLAQNRNFGLLWVGQLISLFGERIHQVALAFLVLRATGSPVEVGFTFAATALPNIVLGPLAGALVDRWDRRLTMIGCDLVRAAMVLSVPFLIGISVFWVYVVAFLLATVTLLFRPAKTAIIPRLVAERDLVTANSASSIADGAADLVGLPLAGILVASLGAQLGLAFVLDAATYVISALLLWAMVVPREVSLTSFTAPLRPSAVWTEVVEGWRFLRSDAQLFTNTLLSAVAQLAVGAEIVATVPYAEEVLLTGTWDPLEVYAWILGAIAVGSVAGGTAVGALGERVPKGWLVLAGFVAMGLSLAAAGLVTNPYAAIGIFFVVGVANMLFIIPTITMFQQRTPQRLMGRVVSSRQALVFGSIAASMAISGILAEAIGSALVLIVFGLICALTGVIGIFLPAMRNAR